jgi:hypothetical protein
MGTKTVTVFTALDARPLLTCEGQSVKCWGGSALSEFERHVLLNLADQRATLEAMAADLQRIVRRVEGLEKKENGARVVVVDDDAAWHDCELRVDGVDASEGNGHNPPLLATQRRQDRR